MKTSVLHPQCKKQILIPKEPKGAWLKVHESLYSKKSMDHGNKGQLQNPLSPSSFHTMPSYTIFFNFELLLQKGSFVC